MIKKTKNWMLTMMLMLFYVCSYGQTILVSGTVTDTAGETMPGVNVVIKGTATGTVTDVDGKYSIAAPSAESVLLFTFIGYQPQEVAVGVLRQVDITMQEASTELDEAVVVGFTTQKKVSLVGSVTTIAPQELKIGTTRSLSNNLAGQLAGVIAVQRSGEPGYDNSNYWIRGISTFQGQRNPLILVDGIERSLDNIDPEEIESFSVLKDASASAVYGVRGANGVIIINTKRGKIGKPSVTFKMESAMTQPTKLPDFVGAAKYLEVMSDIYKDAGLTSPYTADQISKIRSGYDSDLYPDVNWIDAISKDYASNMRGSLDVSGGNEILRYSFVAAYYREKGILERDPKYEWDPTLRLSRYNMRSNVDINLTKSTLVRFNIGGYLQERNTPSQSIDDLFNDAFTIPPWQHPIRYSSGEIPRVPERVNPWALATQKGYERHAQNKLETLFAVEQDLAFLLPGLKVKGTFAFDVYASNGVKRAKDPDYYNPASGRDPETGALNLVIASYGQEFLGHERITDQWGDKSNYLEGLVSYNQTFGDHDFQTMFLYNQRNYDNGDKLPFRNQGIAGRLSYMFKQRYIGEVNFGYNGSENFARGSRYGFFPSAAVGWIVSDEAFMEPLRKALSKVKLRASYGLVGNDQLGTRFAYISTINETEGYRWGTSADFHRAGRWEGTVGAAGLTWETVAKTNFGVELGLFNAMELQVDYFVDNRSNIFMQRKSVPASAGFTELPWANFGKVRNQGVDASLIANKQIGGDWYISFRGSFTYAKNEIIEQDEPLTVIGTNRSSTGKPVGQLFGLIAEGLFTEADFSDVAAGTLKGGVPIHTFNPVRPGDIKYRDISGDGRIDALDRTAIGGTEDPQIVYGFGFNIRYKNFDLGAFFQGNALTDRIIGRSNGFLPGSGQGVIGNFFTDVIDNRWTVDNPSQDVFYPRASLGLNTNNSQESTWWLTDMSMLRMKNVELGYNLPNTLLREVLMKHARVYIRGTNPLTISKFKLWDPELANSVGTRYPLMKSYSVGLEISF